MSDEEIINRGLIVEAFLRSEAWSIYTELLRKYQEDTASELLDYQGTDANVMKSKQLAARIMRNLFSAIKLDLEDMVKNARDLMIANEFEVRKQG